METKSVAISLIALTLSGCAHTGYYQQGYGYSGYNSGYGSGYTVERYYDYPARSYYQPGGSMGFGTYYVPSYPSHDYYDHHRDRDRHDNWQHSEHRSEGRPPKIHHGMEREDKNHWEGNVREHQQEHTGRIIDHEHSRPHSPQTQLQSINHDVDKARQQDIHEMRRNGFGNADRSDQRPEGKRSGDGDHGRGHGFGRH